MKKTNTLLLVAFFTLMHISALATNWGKPDKGYFSTQKDIENDVSNLSASMATISFEGQLFNFINYNDGSNSKIIVRKLTNTASSGVNWSVTKQDNITNLKNLSAWQAWQPAPVVFNNVLYLFVSVQEGSDYSHAYVNFSKYNSGTDSWTTPQKVPGNLWGVGSMAAAVLGDKLCLITWGDNSGTNDNVAIFTTTDLVTWTTIQTDFAPLHEISVITKSFLETKPDGTQKLNSKLVIGYLNGSKHAMCAEYQYDDSGQLIKISSQTISTDMDYQSIVLADGSVTGDPSTGNCVQAFLKKDSKDNGYCRYRIQRYQSISGAAWTKQENNLVKQNYLWADKNLNMTGATFAVNDGPNTIRQYMCLIYRGYDDWDHPLNCAYVETDHLTLIDKISETLAGPENTQYIGYIEGPPPFYLNKTATYQDSTNHFISELEYANTVVTTDETELGFDVGITGSCMFHGYSASLNYTYGHQWTTETEKKVTGSVAIHGMADTKGYYLTLQPIINRATYKVYDVHNQYLYTTYYFYMSQPEWRNVSIEGLQNQMEPSAPETYMHRNLGFDSYDKIDKENVSWTEGADGKKTIEVSTSNSVTNTHKVKVKLGKEWGEEHIWSVGVELEGNFEFKTTTTTLNGDEITCHTRLNDAVRPTDITDLMYDIWWLKRTDNRNNWWLYPGQDTTQNTWCVTYEVTYLKRKNGSREGYPAAPADPTPYIMDTVNLPGLIQGDQISSEGFSLSQNYPNPFSPATKIKYQIGTDRSQENSTEVNNLARLVVYNLSGKEVATLVNENKAPGSYEVSWDASQLSPGVYFYSLQCGSYKDVKKLVLLKQGE
jgi:hypothetical protein